MARACGSYPQCRWFKSNCRYQPESPGNGRFGIRPDGQAVKTPPFHGGNTGSIPVRVTINCWCGGIGRHKGLKIPRTYNPYRFKSGHQHHTKRKAVLRDGFSLWHKGECFLQKHRFCDKFITKLKNIKIFETILKKSRTTLLRSEKYGRQYYHRSFQ